MAVLVAGHRVLLLRFIEHISSDPDPCCLNHPELETSRRPPVSSRSSSAKASLMSCGSTFQMGFCRGTGRTHPAAVSSASRFVSWKRKPKPLLPRVPKLITSWLRSYKLCAFLDMHGGPGLLGYQVPCGLGFRVDGITAWGFGVGDLGGLGLGFWGAPVFFFGASFGR